MSIKKKELKRASLLIKTFNAKNHGQLDKKGWANARDHYGHSPLHKSVMANQVSLVFIDNSKNLHRFLTMDKCFPYLKNDLSFWHK